MIESETNDNPRIYKTLKTLDPDSINNYPTTFWFYSDVEQCLIVVSKMLMEFGYSIEYCGLSARNDYLLITKMDIPTTFDDYEQLWHEFEELANDNEI